MELFTVEQIESIKQFIKNGDYESLSAFLLAFKKNHTKNSPRALSEDTIGQNIIGHIYNHLKTIEGMNQNAFDKRWFEMCFEPAGPSNHVHQISTQFHDPDAMKHAIESITALFKI